LRKHSFITLDEVIIGNYKEKKKLRNLQKKYKVTLQGKNYVENKESDTKKF
jgi:hypothetical protein